jgi:hypothetical protein
MKQSDELPDSRSREALSAREVSAREELGKRDAAAIPIRA